MGISRGLALAAAAALGAAVAVVPAVASSEPPPPIEAEEPYSWHPAAATVGEGGSVVIANHTGYFHGVEWRSGPETPSCSKEVPIGTSGTSWSGTCTFLKPGTYEFWCSVHHSLMSATVTVQPAATTTGTTGTTPGGTTGTIPGGGGGGGTNVSPPVSPLASSPIASAAVNEVKIHSHQRGHAVRGSFAVSGGGQLEVNLLARRNLLASARSSFTRVGRIVRSSVGPGTFVFKVPLSKSGRRALARAARLALVVQIVLAPRSGKRVVVKRPVSLRA